MSVEDRLEVLENQGKKEEKTECVFCIDYYNFFSDIVKNAYSLKLDIPIHSSFCDDRTNCVHHKYPELKDSLRTAGFILESFITNDYDMNSNYFVIAQIYNYEDIRKTLLDDTLRQFILARFYLEMRTYSAWLKVWTEDLKRPEEQRRYRTQKQVERAQRVETEKIHKEAEIYYKNAKECLELSLDFIRDYDLTGHEWQRTNEKHPTYSLFRYQDELKDMEKLLGLKFPGERPKTTYDCECCRHKNLEVVN